MNDFPLSRIRAQTRGIKRGIFMNSSSASLRPTPVTTAVKAFLDLEDELGSDEAIRQSKDHLAKIPVSIATMIGAEANEIALMESNTIGWHTALAAVELRAGDDIIVSRAEYVSGLIALLEMQQRLKVRVLVVEYDSAGLIDLEQLQALLSVRTKLVCLTHIASSNGNVQPVAQAGRIIRQHSDALFLLDACQSVGQRVLDVKEIGCHALTATGRKYMRGPRGTGFLYVEASARKKLRPRFPDGQWATLSAQDEISLIDGARQYETYEKSHANFIGLGRAVDYALEIGMDRIQARTIAVGAHLRARIAKIDGLALGEISSELSGGVTFASNVTPLGEIYEHLHARQVSLRHIHKAGGAWDFAARQRTEVLRLSVHYFNTVEECDAVGDMLEEIAHS